MIDFTNIKNKFEKEFSVVNFDTSKLSTKKDARTEFNIPEDETIFAFVSQKILLFSHEVLVFTDKAIYTYNKERITWEKSCEYIACRNWLKSSCRLVNSNDEIKITNSKTGVIDTIIQETQGQEVSKLISAVQEQLTSNNKSLLEKRSSVINEYFANAKERLHHSYSHTFDDDIVFILQGIANEKLFSKKVWLLLGENALRHCSPTYVFDYINLLEKESPDNLDIYQDLAMCVGTFIEDLKNPHMFFSHHYVKTLSRQKYDQEEICSLDNIFYNEFVYQYKEILLLAYLRAYPYNNYNDYLAKDEFPKQRINELFKFCCQLKNNYLLLAFNDIQNGNDVPDYLACGNDGLGLTPLHYALSCHNEDYIKTLDNQIKPIVFAELYSEIADVLDLSIVAKYLGYSAASKKLFERSPLMQSLKRTKRKYQRMLALGYAGDLLSSYLMGTLANKENNLMEELEDTDENRYYKIIDSDRFEDDSSTWLTDDIADIRMRQDKIAMSSSQIQEQIESIKMDLEDVKNEIERCREIYNTFLDKRVEAIKNSEHPFVKRVLSMYNDPEKIKEYLSNTSYKYQTVILEGYHFFVDESLAEEINIWNHSINEKIKKEINPNEQSKSENTTKTYGDSWFSPNAHKNVAILGTEYKKLAKIYHPDVNPEYSSIFVEINIERSKILDSFNEG